MTYGIDPKVLEQVLGANIYYGGCYGPNGEDPLSMAERVILRNMILADLRADHHDHGEEFFSEEWMILKNVIATKPWNSKGTTIRAIWYAVRKKAKELANQRVNSRKPVIVAEAMEKVLKGMA